MPLTWQGYDILVLMPPGAAHSVWWFFADGAFAGWYVNLEDPCARTGNPLYFDEATAAAIRAEGERVVKLIEAGQFPFDGTLTDFRPHPAWPTLRLPAGTL